MVHLIASVAALFVGPLVSHFARSARWIIGTLDGFVLVAVGGLVLLHVLPHSIALGGAAATIAAVVGFLVPVLFHALFTDVRTRTGWLMLALAGLAVHGLLDGAGLVEHDDHAAHGHLGLGIVLHRIPVGLLIWWVVRPRYGGRWAIGVIGLIAGATSVGFIVADLQMPIHQALGSATNLAVFQALVAGALLHVTVHHATPIIDNAADPPPGDAHTHFHTYACDRVHSPGWRVPSALGALAAAALLVAISVNAEGSESHHGLAGGGHTLLTMALRLGPALLVGLVAAGLMRALISPERLIERGRRSVLAQAARGVAVGMPTPVCSCGVLPSYDRLMSSGAPPIAALAFLVVSPGLGLDALIVSLPALGASLSVARLVAVALMALVAALIIGATLNGAHASRAPASAPKCRARGGPVVEGLAYAFGELADHTLPWALAGLAVASVVGTLLPAHAVSALPAGLDVPLLAVLGAPAYLCAVGATPLAAALLHKGISAGAVVAFLMTGPMFSLAAFAALRRGLGRRRAVGFMALLILGAIGMGYAVNAWVATTPIVWEGTGAKAPGWVEWVSLMVLGIVGVRTLLRNGPRPLIGQILDGPTPKHADADHGEPHHAHRSHAHAHQPHAS